jgi:hypothetical protein
MLLAITGCERPAYEAQAAEAHVATAAASSDRAEQGTATVESAAETADLTAAAEPAAAEPTAESAEKPVEPAAKPDDGPPKKGRAPKADRAPRRPGEAEKITFDDLIVGMQADIVFRPFMLTDRAQELDGQRVSITGYMYGGVESTKGNKEFILLRNTECKFGPGGQADHLARVLLKEGKTADFTTQTVKVEGTLAIEPYSPSEAEGGDGNTWAIYRLDDAVLR